jgi:hypothetical protein
MTNRQKGGGGGRMTSALSCLGYAPFVVGPQRCVYCQCVRVCLCAWINVFVMS